MSKPGTVLVFDIETIPDAELLRLHDESGEGSDDEIIDRAREKAVQKSGGSDFLPLAFHKIAVISVLLRRGDTFFIDSKGPPKNSEQEAVAGFFGLIDKYTPQLVSWNGSGFDIPVLHLRAMRHRIVCHSYWQGPGNRYEQYASRYNDCHLDLMDKIAGYQMRNYAKLETAALLCSLPGKMGYGGGQVLDMWRSDRQTEIAAYCETDVLNTFVLWARFMMVSGHITPEAHDEECRLLNEHLRDSGQEHLLAFAKEWNYPDDN